MKNRYRVHSCGWSDCPESVRQQVNKIVDACRRLLGKNLLALYLHGSLALGCYNPQSSDIDLLAVVKNAPAIPEKKAVIDYFLGIDTGDQAASPEISFITVESLKNPVYPPPYELYYDHAWRERFKEGKVDLAEKRFDADLPLHFLAVRERGVCLYGPPAKDIIPEIPVKMCLTSCASDLKWIADNFSTLSPAYIVLNPCRALSLLNTGVFMSKKEGGEWGQQHLPHQFSCLIGRALALYTGAGKTAGFETEELQAFLEFATREFKKNTDKGVLA